MLLSSQKEDLEQITASDNQTLKREKLTCSDLNNSMFP